MAGIIESTKQVYGDFTSGKCVENFKNMSFGDKFKTVLKVAGLALLAGIIVGVLGGFGGGLLGFTLGVGIAALVGTTAFACFTSDASLVDQLEDCARKCAKTVKEAL